MSLQCSDVVHLVFSKPYNKLMCVYSSIHNCRCTYEERVFKNLIGRMYNHKKDFPIAIALLKCYIYTYMYLEE